MNEVDIKAKQQIVEKIKTLTNVLVIVSKNPTVDDLTAAIGLTVLLNKLGKHTTAIFSGALPPAIAFLDPTKVFEDSVDSLRDFIIALDKEKADHLRYKVEGDSVKIFITPYRTTITGDDLEFSQGDYNVQLVLALGISNKENLDVALSTHNQVLSDAPVATLCAGKQTSDLGSISWRDENASSLCEMIMSISEALKTDKPLLDKQIATALLTGIVASTERFSNERTSSKVMTMAAQLMAAGADQQLISARLRESHEVSPMTAIPAPEVKPELAIPKATGPIFVDIPATPAPVISPTIAMPIVDTPIVTPVAPVEEAVIIEEPVVVPVEAPVPAGTLMIEHEEPVEDVFISTLPPVDVAPIIPSTPVESLINETPSADSVKPPVSDFISTLASTFSNPPVVPTSSPEPNIVGSTSTLPQDPTQDHTILTHSYLGPSSAPTDNNANVFGVTPDDDSKSVDIFADAPMSTMSTLAPVAPTIELPMPPVMPPVMPLAMPPAMPDFSSLPPSTATSFAPPTPSSEPVISTLPSSEPTDPGQFKIPS